MPPKHPAGKGSQAARPGRAGPRRSRPRALHGLGAGPVARDDYLALLRQRRDLPAPDWSSAAGLLAAACFPAVDFTAQIMDN